MGVHIICGISACLCGTLVSLLQYYLSRCIIHRAPEHYAVSTVGRQLLNVFLLVVCYLISEKAALPLGALLIGAALGLTVPSFFFTKKLLRLNEQKRKDVETDG